MFESAHLIDPGMDGHATGVDSPPRRPFAWSELVARLAATRDVRTVLADVSYEQGGSFLAAERLLDAIPAGSNARNETAVNPVGLTDRKADEALSAEAAADADHVDREAQ